MAFGPAAKHRAIELIGAGETFEVAAKQVRAEFGSAIETVLRFLWGLEVVMLRAKGAAGDDVGYAMRRHLSLRGSASAIRGLDRAFEFHYWVQPSNAGTPEYKQWWQRLAALFDELQLVGIWAIDNYDLAQLAFETPWPLPGGRVDRTDTGISVSLDAEQTDAWDYLRGRYPDLPLWAVVDDWRSSAISDVAARLALLQRVRDAADKRLDLRVANDPNKLEDGLGFRYVFGLYAQILHEALGDPRPADLRRIDPGVLDIDGHLVSDIISEKVASQVKAHFAKLSEELRGREEALAAVEAYRAAEDMTARLGATVNEARDRMLGRQGLA